MKKLLLVLLVVGLAAFLFVGCIPGITPPPDGEEPPPGEEICPTITITGSYTDPVKGWTYVKGGELTVVVTFAQPTEAASIYLVGGAAWPIGLGREELAEKAGVWDILLPTTVSADKKTYTAEISETLLGSVTGKVDCAAITILVEGCEVCACYQSFKVDWDKPEAKMMLTVPKCICAGCEIDITSNYTITGVCADDLGCCWDGCSGLASWSIDIYNKDPYNECCTIPCEESIKSCSGACPIDCISACLPGTDSVPSVAKYYILMSMLDNVGNEKKYWATIEFDSGCSVGATDFKWWSAANKPPTGGTTNACIDWTTDGDAFTTDVTLAGLRYFIFGEDCK